MKRILSLLLFPFILLSISGCVALVVGAAAGAVGGYAISKDTIQGETERPYEDLWGAAIMVAKVRGVIKQEDQLSGYLEVDVGSDKVRIRLTRLTQTATQIKVSARNKFRLPRLSLAEEIFIKIIESAG